MGLLSATYIYNVTPFSDQISIVNYSDNILKEYTYNTNGSVTKLMKYNLYTLKNTQEFEYSVGGIMKYYKYSEPGTEIECQSLVSKNYWEWEYRNSPLGGREDKRLMYSPEGDSCSSSMTWLYYMRGANGEELAMYHGLQYSADSLHIGRNVLYSVVGYNVDGGLEVIKPDTTREFNVKDHLGNIRMTIAFDKIGRVSFKCYDYKPFGDTLWTSNNSENGWKGFNGESKDLESSYMNMGARIYDPSIGRFLSVDPLWNAFPNQSPYVYSFNNPLSFKDPTGLAPEKERGGGNKLQGVFVWTESEEYYAIEKFTQEWNSIKDYNYNWGDDPHNKFGEVANGGGGSSAPRLGPFGFLSIDAMKHTFVGGLSLWGLVCWEAYSKFTFNFYYGANLPNGMSQEQAISTFFQSIDDEVIDVIASSDLHYVVNFASTDLVTKSYNINNNKNYDQLMGYSSKVVNNTAEIWISTEMFFDKNDRPNFIQMPQELSDVFHHEWAHTWLGSNVINYYSFSSDTRENMADIIMNDFRIKNGKSPIDFRYTIVPFWDEGWTTYYFNNWDKFQEGKWRR